jgi:CD1 antigen
VAAGCELHSGKGFVGFLKIACQGSNFFSFQNKSCSPSPNGGGRAQQACSVFNQYNSYTERVHRLLSDTCLMFLWGLLEAGKAKFQRQGQCFTFSPRIFFSKIISCPFKLRI